jgi:hypothetical protein
VFSDFTVKIVDAVGETKLLIANLLSGDEINISHLNKEVYFFELIENETKQKIATRFEVY